MTLATLCDSSRAACGRQSALLNVLNLTGIQASRDRREICLLLHTAAALVNDPWHQVPHHTRLHPDGRSDLMPRTLRQLYPYLSPSHLRRVWAFRGLRSVIFWALLAHSPTLMTPRLRSNVLISDFWRFLSFECPNRNNKEPPQGNEKEITRTPRNRQCQFSTNYRQQSLKNLHVNVTVTVIFGASHKA